MGKPASERFDTLLWIDLLSVRGFVVLLGVALILCWPMLVVEPPIAFFDTDAYHNRGGLVRARVLVEPSEIETTQGKGRWFLFLNYYAYPIEFFVREPCPSVATGTSVRAGRLDRDHPLTVISRTFVSSKEKARRASR